MFSNGSTSPAVGATWRSSNDGVARVSAAGLVTGVAAGRANVEATFQNTTGTVSIEVVRESEPPVARFTVRGPRGNNVCQFDDVGHLDCTFDGSASSGGSGGRVTEWLWHWTLPAEDVDENKNPRQEKIVPQSECGYFDKDKADATVLNMIVRLRVRNAAGDLSTQTINRNVLVGPEKDNNCGF